MKPQILALLTAIAWGVGGYYEKKGLNMGHLSPQVGLLIRTAIALLIVTAVSFTEWRSVAQAGTKSFLYIAVGGGVLAGSAGLLCFYAAIKGAPLGQVMPIAFTSPLFGAAMGIIFGGEPLTLKTIVGMALTVGGIILLTVG